MTPQEGSQQALLRIEDAERKGLSRIDFSDLVIDRLPHALQRLTQLQALFARDCVGLTDISPLSTLSSLLQLDMSGCNGIRDISPLAALRSLEELSLKGCGQVPDLMPIKNLTSLRAIDLSSCPQIEDLSPLSGLTSLEQLSLQGCVKVTDLSPLENLTSLKGLDISSCTGVSDISPIAALTNMRSLNIDLCSGITSVNPLRHLLPTLEELSVFGCDLDEAFAVGKRFKENVVDRVRRYYEEIDRVRTELAKWLSVEEIVLFKLEVLYKRHAGKILTGLLLLFLAYIIYFARPRHLAASKFMAAQVHWLFDDHQSTRKSYLDYTKIVVEVLFAVVVSGSVFATDLKNWIQGKLEDVTTWLNRKFEEEMRKSIDEPLRSHKAAANIYLWTLEKPRRRFLTGGLRILYILTFDA